ncbi:unnamed protein product [Discula destructiva]
MSGSNQQEDVPLDVRMRNLILHNQAQARAQARAQAQTQQNSASSAPATNQNVQPVAPHNSRQKRPNQAQRRQMSAQMSVPIDTRPSHPHSNAGPSFRQHPVNGNHHVQSRGFQPQHVNNGLAKGGTHPNNSRHHPSPSYPGVIPAPTHHDWRQPNGMQNGARNSYGQGQGRSLYNPQGNYQPRQDNNLEAQIALLQQLSIEILADAEIEFAQIEEKERFRRLIEDACRTAIHQYEREANSRSDFPAMSVQLQCFGSLAAGFATKTSDMDLGLLSPFSQPQPDASESRIPRIVEKVFLDMGLGARLLTRTRVPIIKVCQKPPPKLYADLLEERAKWESGEDDQDLDQELDEDESASRRAGSPAEEKAPAEDSDLVGGGHQQDKDPYQISLGALKQGSKSLANYYGAAKKLLRKLGARDVSSSTASTLTAEDYRILNDVCAAFIRGLADDDLRHRLLGCGTLSMGPALADSIAPFALPRHRSLFGVMAQVEGEMIVMASESRSIIENQALPETQLQNRIAHWRKLQDGSIHQDPLAFNREVQLASDSIKKSPSVAVLVLEQNQHESVLSYHNRALRLLIELGGHDSPQSKILPVVLDRYVHGIHDPSIQDQVSAFVQSLQGPSLRVAATRHKSLQLAKEFEKALEKDLYLAENVDDIQRYIELLRSPLEVTSGDGVHYDTAFYMTPEFYDLLARIRSLQDPARLSPNQPRDRYRDKLEFPKSDIGVQCDINFSAQLALHNTSLLRCYAQTDPRVRPLVLFIKHWAKIRGINTPYRGTLSSYGYVLMVLHYLTNVCRPYVCPNLQQMAQPVPPNLTPQQIEASVMCKGRDVRFWRDEEQIKAAVQRGELSHNTDSLGFLLRGFFEYYAQNGMMSTYHGRGFDWGRDVLSLRSANGLLTKNEKGWTGAKTILEVQSSSKSSAAEPALQQATPFTNEAANSASQPQQLADTATDVRTVISAVKPEVKEVRHRYLFAIEDPFELDHNVARTVTHQGIVAIRDEFRRAWRIIRLAGKDVPQEDLLQDATTEKKVGSNKAFLDLLDELHGKSRA